MEESRVKAHGPQVIKTVNPQKLKEFRDLVVTRMVRFWEDYKDIKIAIGETLAQLARRDDLTGWVRPSQEANMPALADEIARLSKENAELRNQGANGLSFAELKALLESKNLLGFLEENRCRLGADGGIRVAGTETRELTMLGLLQNNPDFPGERLSTLIEAGRKFLTKLELQKLKSQDTVTEG